MDPARIEADMKVTVAANPLSTEVQRSLVGWGKISKFYQHLANFVLRLKHEYLLGKSASIQTRTNEPSEVLKIRRI